ncbi:MAG: hypothetical protein QF554_00905 [Dehalococcoidia bacterium]|jgi:hypothetical protein|nr:hypothetical protein [Dehalococcoidia bacterium]
MTMSLAVLYVTFLIGVAVLFAAWVWGDMPEQGQTFYGYSPLQPDLRHVLVIEALPEHTNHTPAAPLGRHA